MRSSQNRPGATDAAPWLASKLEPRLDLPVERRSVYLPMRDGVRIAVDVHLPKDRRGPLPTIVRQTRYFRGTELREPLARLPIEPLLDPVSTTRRRFLQAGYAWVDVCARGSGASFGSRPSPWGPDEVADGGEVVEWIVGQPWSNGRVGTTGVSYDGTAADFLLTNAHRAVRAAAPRFALWDAYPDIAFPGGIHLFWFTREWSRFNRDLDANRLDLAFVRVLALQAEALGDMEPDAAQPVLARMAGLVRTAAGRRIAAAVLRAAARGVRPVDEDTNRALLAAAVAGHADNFDVHEGALQVECRDDRHVSPVHPEENIDAFSPHAHVEAIEASNAVIYSCSGWFDGAYPHSSVKRFRTVRRPGNRLVLGPWDHGGIHHGSPYSPSPQTAFDHDGELLRFFDRHLRGRDPGSDDPPVRYFTIGEERWKSADHWPPPHVEPVRFHLGEGHTLVRRTPEPGVDEHRLDLGVRSGRRSRWEGLIALLVPMGYPDRAAVGRRLLVYRTARLEAPVEVTGHPVLRLSVSIDADDGHFIAYLEDERPDGRVEYVTEGHLRALHRKLADGPAPYDSPTPYRTFERADAAPMVPGERTTLHIDLLPVSWRFGPGHRIRLALAGTDRDHFCEPPPARVWAVHRGGAEGSYLELPVATA